MSKETNEEVDGEIESSPPTSEKYLRSKAKEPELSIDNMTGSTSGAGQVRKEEDITFSSSNPMGSPGTRIGTPTFTTSSFKNNDKGSKSVPLTSVGALQRRTTSIRNPALLKAS